MHLEYLRENNIAGIKTYDFHLPTNIFSHNETLNPDNEAFCPKKDCYDGLQSIRECKDETHNPTAGGIAFPTESQPRTSIE